MKFNFRPNAGSAQFEIIILDQNQNCSFFRPNAETAKIEIRPKSNSRISTKSNIRMRSNAGDPNNQETG